ncbi:M48 family metalloprotease [Roseisolibacter agri]|uniref:Peptidase M48 domain-containing protein n=1 Tax=Roseisolibacter agri TaxID=2014610 RepID=A0AA37V3I8_9BACT|nr:M48 family metalloprotease [Roseisolibacter agri]GLC26817.1 hypothetical protein rosag_33300 [Roseisolibacter agri]
MTRPARDTSPWRLALLVAEGYAWLLGIVAAFAGVVAFLAWGLLARRPMVAVVALFVGVPSVLVTAAAIRALFFRLPAPRGVALAPGDAPALAAEVEALARAMGAPRVERIVVTTAFNASIVQTGFPFGRPRGTLLLGFPVLATLSVAQLRAVVAHELAHLVHAHGWLAGLVYRTRRSWMQLATAVHERGTMPIFVRWPLARYVPRLEAQSAAVARTQELLADGIAAAHTDARTTADTLALIDVGGRLLDERFWPAVRAAIDDEPEPPHAFARLRRDGVRTADDAAEPSLLAELLASSTEPHDSHPCLAERLAALGEPARLPPRTERSAGEALLGARFDTLAAQLDDEWRAACAGPWRARHESVRRRRARLAALEAGPPSADATFERATLVEALRGADEALPLYRAALDADPEHARAALAIGRLLLDADDEAGVPLVERALARDPALEGEGCALLERFHADRGREVEAHRWHTRATRHATRTAMAEAERTTVSPLDRFVPHELDAAALALVREALAREPAVREAFLAVRELRHSPGRPCVLGLTAAGDGADAVADRVRGAAALGEETAVVLLDRRQQALREVLAGVPGARIG